VRLWTLDGKPAADPFKGHESAVLSVGDVGTVRMWGIAARTSLLSGAPQLSSKPLRRPRRPRPFAHPGSAPPKKR
jgi:hypothetical protein